MSIMKVKVKERDDLLIFNMFYLCLKTYNDSFCHVGSSLVWMTVSPKGTMVMKF